MHTIDTIPCHFETSCISKTHPISERFASLPATYHRHANWTRGPFSADTAAVTARGTRHVLLTCLGKAHNAAGSVPGNLFCATRCQCVLRKNTVERH